MSNVRVNLTLLVGETEVIHLVGGRDGGLGSHVSDSGAHNKLSAIVRVGLSSKWSTICLTEEMRRNLKNL